MASPLTAENIRDYLTDTSGLSSVYVNDLPPTPINAYAVFEYPGLPDVKTHGSGNPKTPALDEGMIQVLARHASAQTARTNIRTVVDALDGLSATINSVVYTDIALQGNPQVHEKAEDGSVTFLCRFRVQSRR